MTRIVVESEMGIVAVCDSAEPLPSGTDQDALIRQLEPLARTGRVFYFVTDDPVRYRIDVLAGVPTPPALSRDLEPCGGSFGLELRAGRLAVHGWSKDGTPVVAGTLELDAGHHALSVLARRPFDGTRHAEDMTVLLGADWHYLQRVNRLGLVGCLPLVLLVITVLARKWQWLWFVLPLLAASWVPYALFKQTGRYKAAERRAHDHEASRPHYVLSVMPSSDAPVTGGFLRV
ncbi:MAG TPA: hypothetical protein VIE36_18950 [Methylomirabilota bacterium]